MQKVCSVRSDFASLRTTRFVSRCEVATFAAPCFAVAVAALDASIEIVVETVTDTGDGSAAMPA